MKKIIMTGSTGFVGLKLVDSLKDHFKLLLVVRNVSQAKSKICSHKNIEFISINDPVFSHIISKFNGETLIHLATFLSSKERNENNINKFIDSNILFGTKVLNACVGTNLNYVLNFGTSLEYRNNSEVLTSSDLYSTTKTAFRTILSYYQRIINYRWINIIPFSIYGKGSPKIVIDYIIESLISKMPVNFTEGNQKIDLIHITDVISCVNFLINDEESYKENYYEFHLGTGQSYSIREIVKVIETKTNLRANINWGALKYSELASMSNYASPSKIPNGWKHLVTLEDGIEDYLLKYRLK